jgi:hypothetical protein
MPWGFVCAQLHKRMHKIQCYFTLVGQQSFSALANTDIANQVALISPTSDQLAQCQIFLDSAVNYAERFLQLDLRWTQWQLTFDRFPSYWFHEWEMGQGEWANGPFVGSTYAYPSWRMARYQQVYLMRGPLVTLNSITYYDVSNVFQTMNTSTVVITSPSYEASVVEPLTPNVWPVTYPRPDAACVTFTTGMSTYPDAILHAIRLKAAEYWYNRENASYGNTTVVGQLGQAADNLLSQYSITAVC